MIEQTKLDLQPENAIGREILYGRWDQCTAIDKIHHQRRIRKMKIILLIIALAMGAGALCASGGTEKYWQGVIAKTKATPIFIGVAGSGVFRDSLANHLETKMTAHIDIVFVDILFICDTPHFHLAIIVAKCPKTYVASVVFSYNRPNNAPAIKTHVLYCNTDAKKLAATIYQAFIENVHKPDREQADMMRQYAKARLKAVRGK